MVDGDRTENCGILVLAWKGWDDWKCNIPPSELLRCNCEKQGPVYLKLRGRCPESVIDKYWTVQTEMGSTFLHGIDTSVIKYDYVNNLWKLEAVGKHQLTTGYSEALYHSFLLGNSTWLIKDDTSIKKNLSLEFNK